MRTLEDGDWQRVTRFCRALVDCPRGFAFLCNVSEAVRNGSYPLDLAGEFLLECARVEPELAPQCGWTEIRAVLAEVAWRPENQAKYRFRCTTADCSSAAPLFFVVDVEDALKRGGARNGHVLTTPSLKVAKSARYCDAAKRQLEELAAGGMLHRGLAQDLLWLGDYGPDEREAPDGAPEARRARVGRLSDSLGVVHIGPNRVVAEVCIVGGVGALAQEGVKVARGTFIEGFDFDLFYHGEHRAVSGWGCAVDRGLLVAAEAPACCDGRAQVVAGGLGHATVLAVQTVAQLTEPPRAKLTKREFAERVRHHVQRESVLAGLEGDACVAAVLERLYARKTVKQRARARPAAKRSRRTRGRRA